MNQQGVVLPPPPPRAQGPRSSMRPLYIALAILAVVLITGFGACGYLIYRGSQFMGFSSSATAPSDFPVYPGARQRSALSMSPQGSHIKVVQVQWATADTPAQVRAFYIERLNQGDWEVTDSTPSVIGFRRRSDPSQTGRLVVTPSLAQSIFQAQFDQPA